MIQNGMNWQSKYSYVWPISCQVTVNKIIELLNRMRAYHPQWINFCIIIMYARNREDGFVFYLFYLSLSVYVITTTFGNIINLFSCLPIFFNDVPCSWPFIKSYTVKKKISRSDFHDFYILLANFINGHDKLAVTVWE